ETFEAPRPDRGAEEMDGGHPLRPQLLFEPQIEVGGVDAHEYIGRRGFPPAPHVAVDTQQPGKTLKGVDIAEDGECVHGMPGLEPGSLHGGPADAFTQDIRDRKSTREL